MDLSTLSGTATPDAIAVVIFIFGWSAA